MNKQDLAHALLKIQRAPCHPEWNRHCQNLATELLQRNPEEFMDFQAVKETMFVGNAEYTFDEFEELLTVGKINANELTDCDVFSSKFQHPKWATTGNTIHHRYHLHTLKTLTQKDVTQCKSILELGGGYGNMARLSKRMGFLGAYYIIDLPEFALLQQYYLNYQGALVNWKPDLNQHYDLFIATWSLSEMPLEDRQPYENLDVDYFLIAFGPEYGGIDNLSYFKNFGNVYPDHAWMLLEAPYLDNQYYLCGGPR